MRIKAGESVGYHCRRVMVVKTKLSLQPTAKERRLGIRKLYQLSLSFMWG